MTDKLATVSAREALTPRDIDEVARLAKIFFNSGLAQNVRSMEDMATRIIFAVQVGLPITVAVTGDIAIINGKPSLYGDQLLALVQSHKAYVGHEEMTIDQIAQEGRAVCTFFRLGKDDKVRSHRATFSLQDAEHAGLTRKKGPWQDYPDRMLQMRARAWAARAAFADALGGFQSAEEMTDVEVHVRARTVEPVASPEERAEATVSPPAKQRIQPVEKPQEPAEEPAEEPAGPPKAAHKKRVSSRRTPPFDPETYTFERGDAKGKTIREAPDNVLGKAVALFESGHRSARLDFEALAKACKAELARRMEASAQDDAAEAGDVGDQSEEGEI